MSLFFFIFLRSPYYCFTRLPCICCHNWLFHNNSVVYFLLWLIIPMAKHFVPNFGVIICNISVGILATSFPM